MTKGQRVVVSLLAAIVLLPLTGCWYTYHAYPGKRLSKKETAQIGTGGGAEVVAIDGREIPWPKWADTAFTLRVLPGSHDLEVERTSWAWAHKPPARNKHLRFDAEAGESYLVHWRVVNDANYLWVAKYKQWGLGSFVAGEKPPEK